MPQISYADLHCDSVTESCKSGGCFSDFSGQVNIEKLKRAGCVAQCFALFTEGENAAEDFERFAAYYNAQIAIDPRILPVESYSDLEKAEKSGRIAAILTVENMGFLKGDIGGVDRLARLGVKMASLVWNNANAFAFPNLIFNGNIPDFSAREARGLTAPGKEAVEELNAKKIIIDISHLSDGGAYDVLSLSSAPVVASHSNCAAVHPVSRNLTDGLIKKIANSGGVVGLNFCRDFLGGESAFGAVLAHYKHLVNIGGEDVAAIGSDFDGIPPYAEIADCGKLPSLFDFLSSHGVRGGAIEKFARLNFYRVFKEVVG